MNHIINEENALALLDELNIKYTYYAHESVSTMEDCSFIGADVGAHHYKNLFLTTRSKSAYYILLLDVNKRFNSSNISHALCSTRLCFASPDELMERLGLIPGSVTVMGLMNENAGDVTVAIDRQILSYEKVCLHPCVPTASVAIDTDALLRLLAHFTNKVVFLDIDD